MVTYSGAFTDSGPREALPPVDGREVLIYTLSWTAYPGLLLRLVLRVILLLVVYAAAIVDFTDRQHQRPRQRGCVRDAGSWHWPGRLTILRICAR